MTFETALPKTMKAWVCRAYGGPEVLALRDLPVPAVGDDGVLIRVEATTVSSGDRRVRALDLPPGFGPLGRPMLGFRRPRRPVLGTELAGTVAAVGPRVAGFRPGDAVVAFPGARQGAHAEYCLIAASGPIVARPETLSIEQAAALSFGGTTALHFLDKAGLRPDERLLVIGASGAVGSAMVQIAHAMGAAVTGVASTANLDLVRALGAENVVDYTREDVTAAGATYDVVADTVGAGSFARCEPILAAGGRYLAIAGGLADMLARGRGGKRSISGAAAERPEDLRRLAALAGAGKFTPLVDGVLPFARLPEAHARADTGRKRGSVVVTLG